MDVHVPDEGQARLVMKRGGARKGAGRKKTGLENRKASISLPPERWELLDQIHSYIGGSKSDVLAELLEIGLSIKGLEMMNTDGSYIWEGETVDKETELRRIRGEYAKVLLLSDDMTQEKKDQTYGKLMTEMERLFKIPAMRNAAYEQENPEVMRIYRELSNLRATL